MSGGSTVRAERAIARCREIARFSEVAGETTRRFLSAPMHGVHALVGGWMRAAGMEVRVDAAGNLRGVLRGSGGSGAGRLVIGSHLDTVPNAGAFDGVLGVAIGVALAEELGTGAAPFDLEVIGFSEEEGVRFGRPFLGSLAIVGELGDELLRLRDADGVSVAEAIRGFGLDPGEMAGAALADDVMAYVEFHIEQGPVLEAADRQVGVVLAVAGQTRVGMIFTGRPNHAGTTPMRLRQDAIAAAAEWVVAVEALAVRTEGLVATVGRVEALPGVGNVIAGVVRASLDVRHAEDEARGEAVEAMLKAAEEAGRRRGVRVEAVVGMEQGAVAMDAGLVGMLGEAARRAGFEAPLVVSGAGHDAMVVAPRVPAGMLFLRSPGGVSHHPDEAALGEDVEAALRVGVELMALLR